MKFLSEDFLLTNESAKMLFHKHAEKMPIIDYHCHLEPAEIYENEKILKFNTNLARWGSL